MGFTPEQKKEIVEALTSRGAVLPCPRCGNQQFGLLEGFFNQTVQPQIGGIVIGGPSVPSVVIYCVRCGYIAQHSVGSLNLSWMKDKLGAIPEGAKE